MITHSSPSALDLFSVVQSRVTQLQRRFNQFVLNTSTPSPIGSNTIISTFVYQRSCSKYHADLKCRSRRDSISPDFWDFVLTGLEGISLHIVSYLDGTSLGRIELINQNCRNFILKHRNFIYSRFLENSMEYVIPSSTPFKSFLLSLRHELDQELAHIRNVQRTHMLLEEYCTIIEPENHGFIAMFCDLVRFPNPKVSRSVAHMRQSALGMVLVQTPAHILAFRHHYPNAGPITFVPIDNPHWPQFELPLINSKGFLGYAFDQVDVLKEYRSLHHTVVKSILKDLALFDTAENAVTHGHTIGKQPYAAIINSDHHSTYQLTFSNRLREELRHLPVKERIQVLSKRIETVDYSITKAKI